MKISGEPGAKSTNSVDGAGPFAPKRIPFVAGILLFCSSEFDQVLSLEVQSDEEKDISEGSSPRALSAGMISLL